MLLSAEMCTSESICSMVLSDWRRDTETSVLLVTKDDGPSDCINCSDSFDAESQAETPLTVVEVACEGSVHFERTESGSSGRQYIGTRLVEV